MNANERDGRTWKIAWGRTNTIFITNNIRLMNELTNYSPA